MKNISEYFGCLVFDDRVMKANLSAKVYQSLKKTIDEGAQLLKDVRSFFRVGVRLLQVIQVFRLSYLKNSIFEFF